MVWLRRRAVLVFLGADVGSLFADGVLLEAPLFSAFPVKGNAHLFLFLALQGVVEALLGRAFLLILGTDLLLLLALRVMVIVQVIPQAHRLVLLALQVVVDAVLVRANEFILEEHRHGTQDQCR